jgi:hypothetical protein
MYTINFDHSARGKSGSIKDGIITFANAEEKRINVFSIPCAGEGYRTHIFADGRYMTHVIGHSIDDKLQLTKHWSLVGQATILFRGKRLTSTANEEGRIDESQFEVVYTEEEEQS